MSALASAVPTVAHALGASFDAPKVDYLAVSPMLVVFGVAILGILVEAFAPRESRFTAQVALALGGLVAAFALVAVVATGDTGHGFKFSAVAGRWLADLAEGRPVSDDLARFRLARLTA